MVMNVFAIFRTAYQPQRVVIGQESVGGHGVGSLGVAMLRPNAPSSGAASSSTMAPHSDVLLPGVDVDSEDGLSLMRPAHGHGRHPARDAGSKASSSSSRRSDRHRSRRAAEHEDADGAAPPPALSVVSDATCATFNSSNVAALRIRSLEAVDAIGIDDVRQDEGEYAVHEIDEESRSRSPSLSSSSSSCSRSGDGRIVGNRNGKTETCI
jgi:hypothetical protein